MSSRYGSAKRFNHNIINDEILRFNGFIEQLNARLAKDLIENRHRLEFLYRLSLFKRY